MKTPLLTLAVLLAGLSGAALLQARAEAPLPAKIEVHVPAGVPNPAQQMRDVIHLMRANDLLGLMQAVVPPAEFRTLREAYEAKRLEPSSEREREEFAEGLAKLIAADAVDTLMAELEPQLAKGAAQSEGMLLIGLGALNIAANSPDSDLTDTQQTSLKQALPGLQRWIIAADFFNPAVMRDALTLLSDAARRSGIRSLDELKALPFEELLGRAGSVFGAAKQALFLYGLDVEAIAATTRVELLALEGDRARIRTTVTVFDAPIASEHELVLLEGRWYSREALSTWQAKVERRAAQAQGRRSAKGSAAEIRRGPQDQPRPLPSADEADEFSLLDFQGPAGCLFKGCGKPSA